MSEDCHDSKIKQFMPKDISPHAIVSHLHAELSNIDELFIVMKDKDGNYNEVICGQTGGLAYAILVLQQYWMEHT